MIKQAEITIFWK